MKEGTSQLIRFNFRAAEIKNGTSRGAISGLLYRRRPVNCVNSDQALLKSHLRLRYVSFYAPISPKNMCNLIAVMSVNEH